MANLNEADIPMDQNEEYLSAHIGEQSLLLQNKEAAKIIASFDEHEHYERLDFVKWDPQSHTRGFTFSKKQGTSKVTRFDYICHFNPTLKKLVGVVYFGAFCEGPKNCVQYVYYLRFFIKLFFFFTTFLKPLVVVL